WGAPWASERPPSRDSRSTARARPRGPPHAARPLDARDGSGYGLPRRGGEGAGMAASTALQHLTAALPKDLEPAIAREVLVYSYYRDAELRGSNLLYLLLRLLEDGEAQVALSEHLG